MRSSLSPLRLAAASLGLFALLSLIAASSVSASTVAVGEYGHNIPFPTVETSYVFAGSNYTGDSALLNVTLSCSSAGSAVLRFMPSDFMDIGASSARPVPPVGYDALDSYPPTFEQQGFAVLVQGIEEVVDYQLNVQFPLTAAQLAAAQMTEGGAGLVVLHYDILVPGGTPNGLSILPAADVTIDAASSSLLFRSKQTGMFFVLHARPSSSPSLFPLDLEGGSRLVLANSSASISPTYANKTIFTLVNLTAEASWIQFRRAGTTGETSRVLLTDEVVMAYALRPIYSAQLVFRFADAKKGGFDRNSAKWYRYVDATAGWTAQGGVVSQTTDGGEYVLTFPLDGSTLNDNGYLWQVQANAGSDQPDDTSSSSSSSGGTDDGNAATARFSSSLSLLVVAALLALGASTLALCM
jgi:hypothetical protein